jgi:hypothetical protein
METAQRQHGVKRGGRSISEFDQALDSFIGKHNFALLWDGHMNLRTNLARISAHITSLNGSAHARPPY